MDQMILTFPLSLADALRIPPAEQQDRLRAELAVRLYQKRLLTLGKARELAQLSKWEFHFLLAQEGVIRHYDVDELTQDLNTLDGLA